MDEKSLDEVKSVVEHASHGNWIPFSIVCACLGLCVLMFVFILKMKEKQNNDRHDTNDSLLAELTKGNIAMNTMIAVHENEINNLKKSL